MTIDITIRINPAEPLPVSLLRETAKYLLFISGANLVQEQEAKNDTVNNDGNINLSVGSDGSSEDVRKTVESPVPEWHNPQLANNELDIDGKAWDYKMHSSKRTKNQDGRWKVKRSTDSAVKTVAEQAPTPPPAEDLLGKFMSKVTEKIVAGKMTHAVLANFLRENGIPDVPSIQNYPHLLPELIRKIEA